MKPTNGQPVPRGKGRGNWRERQAARREKRQQIEKSYREHTTPQVRVMRQENWMKRVNPEPQFVPTEREQFACPTCEQSFGSARHLRNHVEKRHFPHQV